MHFRNGDRNGTFPGEVSVVVWAHKGAGGQDSQGILHIHPYQSPVINYYADGMESNFIWLSLAFLQVQHYCQRDCGFLK